MTALITAVGNDYLATPFLADFWLDDAGRVRHVRVNYRTAGGGRIVVNAALTLGDYQLATQTAEKMKRLLKDANNLLAVRGDHDTLIVWLAYREAKDVIKFDENSGAGAE